MKKVLLCLMAALMLFALAGCGTETSDGRSREEILAQNGIKEAQPYLDSDKEEDTQAAEEKTPAAEEKGPTLNQNDPANIALEDRAKAAITEIGQQSGGTFETVEVLLVDAKTKLLTVNIYDNGLTKQRAEAYANAAVDAVGNGVDDVDIAFFSNGNPVGTAYITEKAINAKVNGDISSVKNYAQWFDLEPSVPTE